jgi:hypothetical protein
VITGSGNFVVSIDSSLIRFARHICHLRFSFLLRFRELGMAGKKKLRADGARNGHHRILSFTLAYWCQIFLGVDRYFKLLVTLPSPGQRVR